jgi:hypothetical protein
MIGFSYHEDGSDAGMASRPVGRLAGTELDGPR